MDFWYVPCAVVRTVAETLCTRNDIQIEIDSDMRHANSTQLNETPLENVRCLCVA